MPTYAFMCERCKKSFEVVLTVAERAAAKVARPTLWRRRAHTPDGDLYRKDLTKGLRTTGRPCVPRPLDIPVPGHKFA
jgi:hypothetical protein